MILPTGVMVVPTGTFNNTVPVNLSLINKHSFRVCVEFLMTNSIQNNTKTFHSVQTLVDLCKSIPHLLNHSLGPRYSLLKSNLRPFL